MLTVVGYWSTPVSECKGILLGKTFQMNEGDKKGDEKIHPLYSLFSRRLSATSCPVLRTRSCCSCIPALSPSSSSQ